jgi:hypothetical protein
MRPEVVWRGTRRGRAWHAFKDGADVPVCGVIPVTVWTTPGNGRHIHKECWRLCPWKPRLNAVMTEEQISHEIDGD